MMRSILICLCLMMVGGTVVWGQSFENIRIFPLGETPDSLYRAGYYRKVLPYAESAFAALANLPVPDTATYAKVLYRLGEIEFQAGYYDRAFPHLQDAFSLYYGLWGMNDDTCARMCCALAHALVRAIRWEEDDSMLTRVIAEAEYSRGVSEFARISLRWCQGNVYHNQRKYAPAKQIYEQCKAGWEALGATQTEEYCMMLYDLSGLYDLLDDIESSIRLNHTGLAIHRQIYGEGHPGSAYFLNGLAMSNRRLGNWNEAIAYFEELSDILREKFGEDSWWLGLVIYNFANVYIEIGDYEKARRLHEQSLRIILATQGKKHSDYPMLLSALARVAQCQKEYDTADSLFQESLRLRVEILGKRHPYYPAGLADLASVYLDKGRPGPAFALLQEALAAQKEIEGPGHSSVAYTLQQMALCKLYEGQLAEADSIMNVSSELYLAIFGDNSIKTARHNDYCILSRICLNKADIRLVDWAAQGHGFWKNAVENALSYASAHQLESILHALSVHNDLINAVCVDAGAAALAYDNALLFKGLALQSRCDFVQQLHAKGDTAAAQAFQHWQQVQRRLAGELAKPLVERRLADSLDNLLSRLERTMVEGAAAGIHERRIPGWQAVQQALHPHEAAVEFIHYTLPKPLPNAGAVRYAALLLLPGAEAPRLIPLFEENSLAGLLEQNTGAVAALYARSGKLLDERPHYGAEMYNLIWKPLAAGMPRRVRTVYVSSSGLLHRVNLSALPLGKNKVLADRHTIRKMDSTRQLVRRPSEQTTASTAVLYGGIRYTVDSTAPDIEALAYRSEPRGRWQEDLAAAGNRDSSYTWAYLPGTESEVTRLNDLLQGAGFNTRLFSGWSATEEYIKALGYSGEGGPGVLHIATHGYFFPPAAPVELSAGNTFQAHRHPLFRSGLILSGAAYAWRNGQPYNAREDGILTAYEISHLNLSNTKLAVLSACQTGLGDLKGSEGVYGLQRAFKMAGVQYLLVSLWPVPDNETAAFMEAFYQYWLSGKTIPEAFAKAQKSMRRKYKVVEKWGAWVLIE